nr:AIPR family protein [Nitratireductor sp. XY-223]
MVNGGQTTASLFHTRRRDKASLENVFVQMKLSVIPSEASEAVVPKISEYANTQNRVNDATSSPTILSISELRNSLVGFGRQFNRVRFAKQNGFMNVQEGNMRMRNQS